jgi:hypothetical protein
LASHIEGRVYSLGKFMDMVLSRLFGPKREEVTGDWRKLHIEELHILYSSLGI